MNLPNKYMTLNHVACRRCFEDDNILVVIFVESDAKMAAFRTNKLCLICPQCDLKLPRAATWNDVWEEDLWLHLYQPSIQEKIMKAGAELHRHPRRTDQLKILKQWYGPSENTADPWLEARLERRRQHIMWVERVEKESQDLMDEHWCESICAECGKRCPFRKEHPNLKHEDFHTVPDLWPDDVPFEPSCGIEDIRLIITQDEFNHLHRESFYGEEE